MNAGGSQGVTPFVWTMVSTGSIIAAAIVGPLADQQLFTGIFVAAAVCFGQLLLPLATIPEALPVDVSPTIPTKVFQPRASVSSRCELTLV